MQCVRIWFTKTGRVKYVSHLDIMRCIERAVRRAKIPLWYTEGYNPRPYLNFLQPLPLGVEGLREPLDIRIEGEITNEAIKDKLNSVLPDGVRISDVREPYLKATDIAYSEYEIYLEKEDNLTEMLEKAMNSDSLTCEKPGKLHGRKTIKTVNISENIKKYSISDEDNSIVMSVVLPCGNTINVNPLNLLKAVNDYLGTDIVPLNVRRIKILDEQLSDFE